MHDFSSQCTFKYPDANTRLQTIVVKMKSSFFAVLFALIMIKTTLANDYPKAEISNNDIKVKLYLPDEKKGYYTSTRFDWSGIIYDLEYKGHSYFGSWIPNPNPLSFTDKLGPVDVFSPILHSSNESGDKLIKIGIGLVASPSDNPYHEKTKAVILDSGTWSITKENSRIQFTHKLNADPFAYEYTKNIQLTRNEPEFVLTHTLKNTGTKPLKTSVYNHNFIVIDQKSVGKGFEITFSKSVSGSKIKNSGFTKVVDNKIVFTKDFSKYDHINSRSISGYADKSSPFECTIINHLTGAGLTIKGDQPISKLALWSYYKTISPEPFTSIEIKPGEIFSWNYHYTFFIEKE